MQFSDGVTTENTAKGVVIKEDGKVLAEGNDYFIPALWNEDYPEVIAFSKSGYQNRTWEFPRGWEGVKAVDVYEITGNEMAEPAMSGVEAGDGRITLSVPAGKGYSIVPAGADMGRKFKHVQEVKLAEENLTLEAGARKKLHTQIVPEGATDQGIRWHSSNPEVAEVSNASIVTAKTAGTAVITGTSVDGGKTAACTITVQGNMEKVAPLSPDKASGSYEEPIVVSLATATEGAAIHYTTDGTEPTAASPLYQEPIKVAESMTVQAIAVKEGYLDSPVAKFTYEINIQKPIVEPKENEVYLSDLDWKWAYAGTRSDTTPMFGDEANLAGSYSMPKKDMRYEKSQNWSPTTDMHLAYDALKGIYSWDSIAASPHTKKMEKGIGTSACSEIVYALGGDYAMFRAIIGFDASVLTNQARPSSVQFKVLGSKTEDAAEKYETLYESEIAYTSDAGASRPYFMPEEVEVSTEGYQYLKLWVSDAGETGSGGANAPNQSDAVNWAYARIEKMPPADTAELQEKAAAAAALKETDYTSASWEALKEALGEAEELLQKPEPKPSEVDAALKKLEDAISRLEQKAADKSALESKVSEAKALKAVDYTPVSWTELEKALAEAEGTLKEANAKQSEADAAYQKLAAAINALEKVVPKADKTRLQKKVNEAKALKSSDYTASSWNILKSALQAAESVLSKEDASQTQVDAALQKLEDAIRSLQKLAPVTPVKKPGAVKAKAASASTTSIKLTWKKASNADGYQILVKTAPSKPWKTVKTLKGGKTTSWLHKKLKTNQYYYYKVVAYRTQNGKLVKGTPSKSVKARPIPAATKKVTAKRKSSVIQLSWKKVSQVSGYYVYRKAAGSKKWQKIATVKGQNKVKYTDKKANKNKTYSYRIYAYKTIKGKNIRGFASKDIRCKK